MLRVLSLVVCAAASALLISAAPTAPTPAPKGGNLPPPYYYTYQGKLVSDGHAYTGDADIRFSLYDAEVDGNQISPSTVRTGVAVSSGVFSADIDGYPGEFDGSDRWLEIAVATPSGSGQYQTLAPRTRLNLTPKAYHAWYADNATYAASAINAGNGGRGGVDIYSFNKETNNFTGPTDTQVHVVAGSSNTYQLARGTAVINWTCGYYFVANSSVARFRFVIGGQAGPWVRVANEFFKNDALSISQSTAIEVPADDSYECHLEVQLIIGSQVVINSDSGMSYVITNHHAL